MVHRSSRKATRTTRFIVVPLRVECGLNDGTDIHFYSEHQGWSCFKKKSLRPKTTSPPNKLCCHKKKWGFWYWWQNRHINSKLFSRIQLRDFVWWWKVYIWKGGVENNSFKAAQGHLVAKPKHKISFFSRLVSALRNLVCKSTRRITMRTRTNVSGRCITR